MNHRLAVLAIFSMIVVAGVAGMRAQAQVPAPVSFLTAGTLALAQAPSDSSSGSQTSGGQSSTSSTQSTTPSSDTAVTRHSSSTTSTWPVSPIWIVIGVIALVALIALVVASSRKDSGSSSTTIVK
jgi:beta-lactamase regulating signal transducer with metallopeptidase domain